MTNEELVILAKQGDQAAKEQLFAQNLKFSNHIANKFCSPLDNRYEDFVATANLGMVKAFNSYRPESGIKFITFASVCMYNEILMFIRSAKKSKSTIRIDDEYVGNKTGESFSLLDILADGTDFTHEQEILDMVETSKELLKKLPPQYQTVAMECIFNDRSQYEVAAELGMAQSYVSRLVCRVQITFQNYKATGIFKTKGICNLKR